MKLDDFDFHLPDDLIATRPANPRSSARLLVSDPDGITDAVVTDICKWLRP
ncbi:MAG: S-adenosylmethionine:tRNA ribosyltransferase-isomerase, partial [Pseudomonadota bacterium]|nr:S-adenosylmethionine:tRNA ribosyltransferase-isomerase [Pseudomonadota bacterium]